MVAFDVIVPRCVLQCELVRMFPGLGQKCVPQSAESSVGVGLSKELRECEFTFRGDSSVCFVDNAPSYGFETDWHFGLFALLGSNRLAVAYEACLRDDIMPVWIINSRRDCERAEVTQLCSGRSVEQSSQREVLGQRVPPLGALSARIFRTTESYN